MAERKKLLLRLDPQVYDAIAKWAADDLRSVNAQIEYALRLALRTAGRTLRPARGDDAADGRTPEPERSDAAKAPDGGAGSAAGPAESG
ncbi:hypothetical protein [Plantactinospora sp. B5E13]|uniref:hypothetical protein n=1 Tax=Plantactinospora sp. B5E13 TaxID=3153758 RepID=UPI00325EA05D